MALDCNTKSACVQREGPPHPCRNHARAIAAATARVWIVMKEVHTVQGSRRSAYSPTRQATGPATVSGTPSLREHC